MSANTTTSARSDIYRVFVGYLQRPRRGRIIFFAMRFYTEHIGCAVACLFCSDFFVYIFSFDFYKSRCNCYIADSIFTCVLYVCKTFFKKNEKYFNAMICYMFFVSKSHSATLFYSFVCATSLRSFLFLIPLYSIDI